MQDPGNRIVIIYSLSAVGLVLFFICLHFRSWLVRLRDVLRIPVLKYLVYPALSDRWRSLAQWSRADVLALTAYPILNILCLWFQSPSISSAGRRAANLSLINMIFQCGAWHLGSLTNSLGLGLRTVHRLHGSVGIMVLLLLAFHVVVVQMSSEPFSLDVPEHRWAVMAASAIGFLVLFSIPIFKNNFYEMFLRLHQGLAIFSVYGIWEHLSSQSPLARLYLYSLIGVSSLATLLLGCLAIYRNGLLGYGFPRASITNTQDIILLRLMLSRPLYVEAGQSISLWILTPSARFRSLVQSHPFVVATWSDAPLATLDLLIEPRSGLTQQLLHYSRSQKQQKPCLAMFSGPHGISVPVSGYDVVLMVASGFGVAAQLPYLKKLMYGYNSRKARTRRVHLVWKLKTLELAAAVKDLLNGALVEDTLDDGYILKISIYAEHIRKGDNISPRATVIKGTPDFDAVIRDEVEGKYIRRVQGEMKTVDHMMVLVSASDEVRHDLRKTVRRYLDDKVDMVELDYQPDE